MLKEVTIEVEGLSRNFGPTRALSNVSFKAYKREILGLLGPNGAGKSTAMRILTTYILPDSGRVEIGGHNVVQDPLAVRKMIGYLPETSPLFMEMTVHDYLRFVGQARGVQGSVLRDRMDWVVNACGLERVYRRPNGQLSKGYKQRVGLAQALIHNPPILILDEPTSGLDPLQIIGIRNLIGELAADKTIIFSSHILQEVSAISDRILIINRGEVVADGPIRELQEQAMKTNRLTIEVKADREEVRKAVGGVRGVLDHKIETLDDGWVRAELRHKFGMVVHQDIDAIIKQSQWPLRQFRESAISLEETFIELVRAAKAPVMAEEQRVEEVVSQ
ncbi:MAG: ATP-binding cassette domain-containing protein [Verrucomicrobiota bacterium]|jgi:ABC-2 type transport system ATP-binding protein|nr:ATP-binding cassette domain-containing protein [Verrucomicrobiota bacterium]HCF96303.1 MFS transporter [Verrucomicrobiota bacterium]